jgi:hypothetical protein
MLPLGEFTVKETHAAFLILSAEKKKNFCGTKVTNIEW